MFRINAIIQFVDGVGRAVVLTSMNDAAVIHLPKFRKFEKGEEIFVEREDWHKRATDWRYSE